VDVVVAAGGAVGTKFGFRVSNASTFSWRKGDKLAARIHSTRAARVTATLLHPRWTRLYRWRFRVNPGVSLVTLHMPRQVRRPGTYWLTWVAESGAAKLTRTTRVRIVSAGERLGRVVHPPEQTVEVVLAGDDIGKDVALGVGGRGVRVVSATADGVFALAAEAGVERVVVVDVDQYDVQLVRDLHTLFPALPIVAIAASADARVASLRAGAKAALSSSVPDSEIARTIARLIR
jgi:hypothetical protein